MSKNLDDLKIILNNHTPPIIAIQETMKPPLLTSRILKNYTWTFKTGKIAHHNVGIGILNHIPFKPLKISTTIPAIAIRIKSPIDATILNLYLPPNHTDYSQFNTQMHSLINQLPKPLIILGDLNAQNESWGCNTTNIKGKLLQNIFATHNLHVYFNRNPTRINPSNGSASILDYCVSDISIASQFTLSCLKDTYGSDHYPTLIHCNASLPNFSFRPKWKYNEANWEEYQYQISESLARMVNLPDIQKLIATDRKSVV